MTEYIVAQYTEVEVAGRKWDPRASVGVCQKGAGGWCVLDGDPFVQDQGWACGRRSGGLDAGFVGLVAVLIS